jgi:hypothetical protein
MLDILTDIRVELERLADAFNPRPIIEETQSGDAVRN